MKGKGIHFLVLLNLFFLLLLFIAAGAVQKENNDIWWHLKTGQILLQERIFPREDIFSHTAPGKPWVLHEWLSQVLFYGIYALGGEALLALFRPLLLLLAGFIVAASSLKRTERQTEGEILFLVFLFFLFIMAVWPRIIIRPHLLSFVMIASFHHIFLTSRKRDKNSLFLIPLIQIVWINMHALAACGIVVAGCYLAGAAGDRYIGVFRRKGKNKGEESPGSLKTHLIVFFLVVFCSFVNPSTYRVFGELASVGGGFRIVKEWKSPFSFSPFHLKNLLFFWFYHLLCLFLFIARFRDLRWSDILIYIGFGILSLFSLRNMEIFFLVTIPLVYPPGIGWIRSLRPKRGGRFLMVAPGAVLALFMIVFVLRIAVSGVRIEKSGRLMRPGLQIGSRKPEGAVNYLLENAITGNMYNSYDFGGYIIWRGSRELKVSIDGRALVYGESLFLRIMILDPRKLEDLIRDYNITYFVLKNSTANVNLHTYLRTTGEWPLVYFDDEALVYIKKNREHESIVRRDEFRHINPVLFELDNNPGAMAREARLIPEYEKEAARVIKQHPDDQAGYLLLGYICFRTGRYEKGAKYYKEALERKPGEFRDWSALAFCTLQTGDRESAERYFKKALGLRPEDAFSRKHLEQLGK